MRQLPLVDEDRLRDPPVRLQGKVSRLAAKSSAILPHWVPGPQGPGVTLRSTVSVAVLISKVQPLLGPL